MDFSEVTDGRNSVAPVWIGTEILAPSFSRDEILEKPLSQDSWTSWLCLCLSLQVSLLRRKKKERHTSVSQGGL